MTSIRPILLKGRWREGFVLDFHTIGSTYLGDDEYGHPVFDTKRTEIGELLYRLKYRSDISVLDEIAQTATDFINGWKVGVEVIIPVPPSRSGRSKQPVLILADTIGKRLDIPVRKSCITRAKKIPELKNIYEYQERIRLLEGAHTIQSSESFLIEKKKILLFDDLYRSGATMNAITELLYTRGQVADVFAFAITRTKIKS